MQNLLYLGSISGVNMEVKISIRVAVTFLRKTLRRHAHTNIHFGDLGISNRTVCWFVSGLHWKAQVWFSFILVFQKSNSSSNFCEKVWANLFSPTVLLITESFWYHFGISFLHALIFSHNQSISSYVHTVLFCYIWNSQSEIISH